jgi:hypothetical protein
MSRHEKQLVIMQYVDFVFLWTVVIKILQISFTKFKQHAYRGTSEDYNQIIAMITDAKI